MTQSEDSVTFTVEKTDKNYVVRTHKNPYIFVSKATKFDALAAAFTSYLQRVEDLGDKSKTLTITKEN